MSDPICPPGTEFAATVEAVRAGRADLDSAVAGLLGKLTDDELLWLLDGDLTVLAGLRALREGYNTVPYEAGRIDRLGIPGIRFTDGPRGVVMGRSTAFPAAIARAAAWDTELERSIGDVIGAEARASGANLFAGVCINLAYAPGWGRSQESYGEDPVLLGAMGAALVQGVNPWVLSCVKHYALNSMEEARFVVDVQVAEDVLHEVYLPHFRTAVEAGADSVMSAYNSVNGTWAGENEHLLTDVLRTTWGFPGFVMTDFVWGLRHPVESVAAGQDLEMPFRQQRARTLSGALADGRLARADVERSGARLLRAQVGLALRARHTPPASVIASPAHRELAREAARRGAVLLRNRTGDGGPLLPLDPDTVGSVAVLGRLATRANLGDVGSSMVRPPAKVTVLEGLQERLGARVVTADGGDAAAAAAAARAVDVAVVVVGLSAADEGESIVTVDVPAMQLVGGIARFRPVARLLTRLITAGSRKTQNGGDRRDLHLRAGDVALVQAVAAANPRTVVVVIAGGTVMLDPWDDDVAAILLAWYPGMEGGRAVADLLLGDAEPTGRLPMASPRRREDLPVVDWRARRVTYGRWWGQRMLDREGRTAAYPFGFGLGYTTFALSDLRLGPVTGETFTAEVSVRNTGQRTGRHVVQVYAQLPDQERPVRALLGFAPVADVEPGATATVTVPCSARPLQRWADGRFTLPPATVVVEAASWSGDPDCVTATLEVGA